MQIKALILSVPKWFLRSRSLPTRDLSECECASRCRPIKSFLEATAAQKDPSWYVCVRIAAVSKRLQREPVYRSAQKPTRLHIVPCAQQSSRHTAANCHC